MIYHQNIFYNCDHLSVDQKKEILIDAKDKCYEWWVDEKPSIQRIKIEMSFDEILTKLDDTCHFVFIHRKGYEDWKETGMGYYLETGFSTMEGKSYYLWILMKEELLDYFIEKYKLNVLE